MEEESQALRNRRLGRPQGRAPEGKVVDLQATRDDRAGKVPSGVDIRAMPACSSYGPQIIPAVGGDTRAPWRRNDWVFSVACRCRRAQRVDVRSHS